MHMVQARGHTPSPQTCSQKGEDGFDPPLRHGAVSRINMSENKNTCVVKLGHVRAPPTGVSPLLPHLAEKWGDIPTFDHFIIVYTSV